MPVGAVWNVTCALPRFAFGAGMPKVTVHRSCGSAVQEDYQVAAVPMLPALATQRQVTTLILIYTWLTAAAMLLLGLATGWCSTHWRWTR